MLRNFCTIILFLTLITSAFAQDKKDALKTYREGSYEDAVKICQQELAENPHNMDSFTVLGWSLLALNRFDEAVTQANNALAFAPYDQRIIAIKGEALYSIGRNREALKLFEQYISISPNDKKLPLIYSMMGEIFIRLGEYNNADTAFSTAIHFDGKKASYWARLGYAREMTKDYTWSQYAYEQALKLAPDLQDAKRGLAAVKSKLAGG